MDQQLPDLGESESSPRKDKFCVQTVEAESELPGKIGAVRARDATANLGVEWARVGPLVGASRVVRFELIELSRALEVVEGRAVRGLLARDPWPAEHEPKSTAWFVNAVGFEFGGLTGKHRTTKRLMSVG